MEENPYQAPLTPPSVPRKRQHVPDGDDRFSIVVWAGILAYLLFGPLSRMLYP